jgi:hypothetical protein
VQDLGNDFMSRLSKAARSGGMVRDDDSKEEGYGSLPILGKAVHDSDYIGRKGALGTLNACSDLALVQSARNYRHDPLSLGWRHSGE